MPSFDRRQVISAIGAAGVGLAGCLSTSMPSAELDAADGHWAMAGQNAAQTRTLDGAVTESATAWTVELPDAQATGTPSLRDETLYIPANATDRHAQSRHQLYAVSATTGELRWYVSFRSNLNAPPAVGAGRVIATARQSTERGRVVAFDQESGLEAWLHDTDARLTAQPTVDGLTVYVSDWDGQVSAFRASDGLLRWSTQIGDDGLAVAEPVAVHGDSLYLGTITSTGNVVVLDADSGEKRWSQSTDIIEAGPVVRDDLVAVRSRTGIEAFDTDGVHRFTFAIPDGRGAKRFAVDDRYLYVPDGKSIHAIDRSGEREWTYEGAEQISTPTGIGETVLTSVEGEIIALSRTDGTVEWRADTEGSGVVVAAENALFLTASNGRVTALES